jgi:hypothetical protein
MRRLESKNHFVILRKLCIPVYVPERAAADERQLGQGFRIKLVENIA